MVHTVYFSIYTCYQGSQSLGKLWCILPKQIKKGQMTLKTASAMRVQGSHSNKIHGLDVTGNLAGPKWHAIPPPPPPPPPPNSPLQDHLTYRLRDTHFTGDFFSFCIFCNFLFFSFLFFSFCIIHIGISIGISSIGIRTVPVNFV